MNRRVWGQKAGEQGKAGEQAAAPVSRLPPPLQHAQTHTHTPPTSPLAASLHFLALPDPGEDRH
eukprot:364228-Chlamydomonas_euryale.AAC.11